MITFYQPKLLLKLNGPTGTFLVLPGPEIVLGICKWCLRTLLIYTDNFLFLSLHQFTLLSLFPKRVEDKQTDRQTDRQIRLVIEANFRCLKTDSFLVIKFDSHTFFNNTANESQTKFRWELMAVLLVSRFWNILNSKIFCLLKDLKWEKIGGKFRYRVFQAFVFLSWN